MWCVPCDVGCDVGFFLWLRAKLTWSMCCGVVCCAVLCCGVVCVALLMSMQAPLGSRAVTEMHKLFEWAKSSKKGLLLFIDEAEAFLGTRERADISEHMRNVLSALLYQTGTQVRWCV